MKTTRFVEFEGSAMIHARLRWRMCSPVSVCANDAYPYNLCQHLHVVVRRSSEKRITHAKELELLCALKERTRIFVHSFRTSCMRCYHAGHLGNLPSCWFRQRACPVDKIRTAAAELNSYPVISPMPTRQCAKRQPRWNNNSERPESRHWAGKDPEGTQLYG